MPSADSVRKTGDNFPLVHVLAGCSSGLVGAIALQPFDVVKTTMIGTFRSDQPDKPIVFKRSWDAARYVAKSQGFVGLWRGLVPSMSRVTIGAGLYFGIINLTLVKNEQGVPTKQSAALAGGLSRTISAIILNPLTLVKTRFEASAVTDQHYTGVMDAIRKISKAEGIRGLYAGLIPTLIRDVPYSSVNVLLFTQFKPIINQYVSDSSATVSLISGSLSGVLATTLTHPFDVIRTRMQIRESSEGVLITSAKTIREDGVTGLFRGIGPRVFRRGLSNALTWTIYEQLVEFYKRQCNTSVVF